MTVKGSSFEQGSTVLWNGGILQTQFVDGSTLVAAVSKSAVVSPAVVHLQVQNSSGAESTPVSITLVQPGQAPTAPLAISTSSLTAADLGEVYTAVLEASGGTPNLTWTVKSGSLPTGLSLSPAGVISGTPMGVGTSKFTVKVTDSGSPAQSETATLSLKVGVAALTITSSTLANGQSGTAYSATLQAAGGTPGYTWKLKSGSLPSGLSLSSAGVISGTPKASGVSTFLVKVTDSGSAAQTQTATLSLTVTAPTLTITSSTLTAGKAGAAYTASLQATGGTPGYTWTVQSWSLPAGLSLNAAGVISGTPTTAGTSNFIVNVSDSGSPAQSQTATLSLKIAAPALAITSSNLTPGKSKNNYTASLQATGGTPGYNWTIKSGNLPSGLNLSSSGVISGMPSAAGTSSFTVQVADSESPAQTQSASLSLTVMAPVLAIASSTMPSGQSGNAYTTSLQATGGTPGYTWTLISGSLPAGVSLSAGGMISGSPTAVGSFNFTVQVADSGSPAQTQSASMSLTVAAPALAITSATLASGQSGNAYTASLQATGGTPAYTWTLKSGSLPTGLSLSAGGVISGTPTAAGTSSFTVQVADSESPAQSQTASMSLKVAAPALAINSSTLANGQSGNAYTASLQATGGTPGYTWSVKSGSLPAGLTLSAAGVISGTPTSAGNSSFTVQVADSESPAQSQTASMSLNVSASALAITSATLVNGQSGNAYNASLQATGGTPAYTWTVKSGSLPAGLSLSSGGVISGTPTTAGTSNFTMQVADSGSPAQTQSASMSLKVSASTLAITSSTLANGQSGNTYTASLQATGGTPAYTWTVKSGSLPAGLSLSSGGVISGTPTTVGNSSFTVQVADSGSPAQSQTASMSLTVAAPSLAITSSTLANGQSGNTYTASLQATGGTPSYTWTVKSGSLPAGLNLSSAGLISGTPTAVGTSNFTVQVADSESPAQRQSASMSLSVAAPALAITSSTMANGQSGNAYSASLQATGGTPGYTWTLKSGSLPAGLSLSSAGVISGTPTTTGASSFKVQVADSGSPAQSQTATLSLTVASPALAINFSTLANAQATSSYTTTLQATGGTPGYTWTIKSGSLPTGLNLSTAGVISGTPAAAGTSQFTLQVTDSGSPAQSQTAKVSLTVTAPALSISSSTLASGTSGSSYSASLQATGGTPGYTWTMASGSLPPGLSLSAAGVISGTPTAAATSSFTVQVADSESPAQTTTATESISISAPAPPIVTPAISGAQNLYLYPKTPVAPRGSYQTVTAVVTGSNDKTVTWTSDGGTIVGTNPCVVNEPCTVALYTTNTGTYHLTAKSNANGSLTATSTITFTDSPTPATTHPRLGGITAAMLPALQAKAVSSNPLYQQLLTSAVNAYNTDSGIWSWSCNGGSGQPNSDQTENYKEGDGYLFAFMSMVDPNDSTYKWGCYGRDIFMYYANFWLNPLNPSYTADTLVIRQVDANYGLTGNHGADSTEALALTPDWLMAGGYLSTSDLVITRAYLALAGQQMVSIALTGTEAAVGGYNSSKQLNTGSVWDFVGQRAMGNNYTHSKILFLTAASLTFNDTATDDPAMANTCAATRYVVCPDGSAGSLHAYWKYLAGGMLYKDWAHLEDPSVTLPAYQAAYSNMPSMPTCEDSASGAQVPCLGDGRGGESSEGSWYQYSLYRLQLALLSISSAGYGDPIVNGPQMSLATSSWWDMKAVSDLEFITYSYYTPQPRFAFLSTGDTLNLFRMPSDFNAEAWMMVSDSLTGRSDRSASLEWPLLNTSVGGISAFYANLGNGYGSDNAIPLFMALPASDPTAHPPADPRPSLPTDLFSGGNQHILARSGWDNNGTESASWGNGGNNTLFSLYCSNTRIDHEHETCGGFDVLSDGEYITKTRTVFNDYNMMLATAEFSNEAGYADGPQSTCTMAGGCFEWQAVQGSDGKGGGQLWHGYQAGSATLAHAELPGYVAAIVDTTKLYNGSPAVGWGTITGVTAASRSLIYLRGSNQVVYYDRGAGGQYSRLWATTTGPITISGSTASWPTRSGNQEAYLTSLLPADATMSDAGAYQTNESGDPGTSDWEPYSHVLIDAGSSPATQFLSVMQWGGSSFQKTTATLVQSNGGQNFDGAKVGSTMVMFMCNWPSTFTGVTYPASGATTHYISDLAPNTPYSLSGNGVPATATTDDAGVLTFSAAGTGNITIGTSVTP